MFVISVASNSVHHDSDVHSTVHKRFLMRHKLLPEDKGDKRMSGRVGGLHVALVCCVFHSVGLNAEHTLVCDTRALVDLPSAVRPFPNTRQHGGQTD